MKPTDTAKSILTVRSKITAAAKLAGRHPDGIKLVAVSKTRSSTEIQAAIGAGQRIFGENRVQEAAEKWPLLRQQHPDIELHLIGQLQSNKAADAVALFDVIHTVDRMSLVIALAKAMKESGRMVPCFIQVNIGDEPQKGGVAIQNLPEILSAAITSGLPIIGLMCIPPQNVEAAPYFALLSELAARHGLSGLSMGMSGDFETAIMLGSTHIRVGTALFGPRDA